MLILQQYTFTEENRKWPNLRVWGQEQKINRIMGGSEESAHPSAWSMTWGKACKKLN